MPSFPFRIEQTHFARFENETYGGYAEFLMGQLKISIHYRPGRYCLFHVMEEQMDDTS